MGLRRCRASQPPKPCAAPQVAAVRRGDGGPEDGFSLTDRSQFESARRTEAKFIDLRPIWSTLEPAPGRYDWTSLDAGFSNAAAVGLPVTITLRFFDRQVPEWLSGENMLDQDGRRISATAALNRAARPTGGRRRVLVPAAHRGDGPTISDQPRDSGLAVLLRLQRFVLPGDVAESPDDLRLLGVLAGEVPRVPCPRCRKFSPEGAQRTLWHRARNWDEVSQPKPTFGR